MSIPPGFGVPTLFHSKCEFCQSDGSFARTCQDEAESHEAKSNPGTFPRFRLTPPWAERSLREWEGVNCRNGTPLMTSLMVTRPSTGRELSTIIDTEGINDLPKVGTWMRPLSNTEPSNGANHEFPKRRWYHSVRPPELASRHVPFLGARIRCLDYELGDLLDSICYGTSIDDARGFSCHTDCFLRTSYRPAVVRFGGEVGASRL